MAKPKHIHRRQIIKWSFPLITGLPFANSLISCNNNTKPTHKKNKDSTKKQVVKTKPKPNNTEVLYYNPKTKVLHYPGLREKEKLETANLQSIKINEWEKMLDNGEAYFNKEKSGLSFEKLALRNFQGAPTAESLQKSLSITSRAFAKEYATQNRFNWRVYDLLVQWVALNEAIADPDKWYHFTKVISEVNLGNVKVIKRMAWVQSKELFDKRITYINEHKTDYLARLKTRLI